jgi:hypothetical protein
MGFPMLNLLARFNLQGSLGGMALGIKMRADNNYSYLLFAPNYHYPYMPMRSAKIFICICVCAVAEPGFWLRRVKVF